MKRIIVGLCVLLIFVSISFTFKIKNSNAQAAGGGGGTSSQTVPVNTSMDFNTTSQYMKSFQLDKIAVGIVKQILHKVTMAVVDWINTGFNGKPDFLENPKAFFLDAADQITGQFITTGPLNLLCSPFSIDIKLSIAGGQGSGGDYNRRYNCTLSKVIQNVKNGVHVGASIDNTRNGTTLQDLKNGNIMRNSNSLSINGNSVSGLASAGSQSVDSISKADSGMDAFMAGDFSQGGWPAFIAMVTEPQNNVTGAYLQAHSDLQQQLAQQKQDANGDLDRSGGFFSWQDCKELTTIQSTDQEGINEANAQWPNASQKFSSSKDGKRTTITYQDCNTATPGSFIHDSLSKATGSSVDEMVNANDINAVINALLSQLLKTALNGGLSSVSKGGNNSFTKQVAKQDAKTKMPSMKIMTKASANLQSSIDNYTEAINTITATRASYVNVRSCFVDLINNPNTSTNQKTNANGQLMEINNIVLGTIDPTIINLKDSRDSATKSLAKSQQLAATSSLEFAQEIPQDGATAQDMIDKQNEYIKNLQDTVDISMNQTDKQDLNTVNNFAQKSEAAVKKYQQSCNKIQNGLNP